MPVIQRGDKLVMRNGSVSSLSRPSVPFSVWNGGGQVSLSGMQSVSYRDLYDKQPWVRIVIDKLNRQVARLPLKTYRILEGTRSEGERERVRDHPLPNLLAKSRERASPLTFKQKAVHPTLLHGNGLFFKLHEINGGQPRKLIPLDWRFITPHLTEAGVLTRWETSQFGEPFFMDLEDVIHFAWEAGNGDLGTSPLKALEIALRTEDSAQRHQAASFDNGVRPSTVYILPPDVEMDPEDKEALRQAIQAQQGGVDRAFQMALVSGGGSIETLQHTAVEAELIEQRKLNREEVAAVYDIPPPLIGILDHATYSNVAEMHRMLYGMVLGPWLALIEETIQAQLIDSYAPWAEEKLFVEFDLAEVLKGDTLKEVQAIKEGIATGILTPNEGRAIRNLGPSDQDGMDSFYLPTNNMQPVGQAASAADSEAAAFDAPRSIARQLEKAAHRLERKDPRGIDPARIERELIVDLDDPEAAREWAARIEQAGTADAIRALTP